MIFIKFNNYSLVTMQLKLFSQIKNNKKKMPLIETILLKSSYPLNKYITFGGRLENKIMIGDFTYFCFYLSLSSMFI